VLLDPPHPRPPVDLQIRVPLPEDVVAATQACMRRASADVLGGFELESDAKIVRYPDRYADDRGRVMWATVMRLLDETTPANSERGTPPKVGSPVQSITIGLLDNHVVEC
jgi:hypothetical protein